MKARKVLMLELNEINWGVIDRLIAQHGASYLPNIARLRGEGAWATQTAVEQSPHLDPWVTWVTVHTGVSRDVHGATVLEQGSETINAKRLWDFVSAAGRSVGIFGSISAYPPRKVDGFIVPGPFAPGDETYPPQLQPVQGLNRLYTQVHNKVGKALTPFQLVGKTLELVRSFGLRPSTLASVALQLVRERVEPHSRWRRVCLQPRLNYDFFAHLYKRYRPDFATWHTNHAAHFMHHYWRAWDDAGFTVPSSAEERSRYGQAVPTGYQLCDELIGRFMKLMDANTVLVIASSMGQQPYVSDRYQDGKIVVRFKNIDRFVALLGKDGVDDVVATMVPQWNLTIPDGVRRAEVKARIEGAYRVVDGRREAAIAVQETDGMLTVTPLGLAKKSDGIRYHFPTCPDAAEQGYPIEELFAVDAPTVKQGMHHPDGILAFYGDGVRKGLALGPCTNLDVAPTILKIMGIPVPAEMSGRALTEVWDEDGRRKPVGLALQAG